jgi:putative flippase GtrA
VGGIGFIVNYASLVLFYHIIGWPIIIAQIIGAELALLSTFIGNNFWAFTHHNHIPLRRKFITFHISALMGILINSLCVILLVHFAHLFYGLALVVGSAAGLIWNYTLYTRFVFKAQSSKHKD